MHERGENFAAISVEGESIHSLISSGRKAKQRNSVYFATWIVCDTGPFFFVLSIHSFSKCPRDVRTWPNFIPLKVTRDLNCAPEVFFVLSLL